MQGMMGAVSVAIQTAFAGIAAASGPAYVVHGAVTNCSCGLRQSHVVVPISHGSFIHNTAQLTIQDFVPVKNVQIFGGCTSPQNPSVQAAAAAIVKKVNSEPKSFWEKVAGIFCKSDETSDASFVSQCAGACTPMIVLPWSSGKKGVILDGARPLLYDATLVCTYGGVIKLETSGQPE